MKKLYTLILLISLLAYSPSLVSAQSMSNSSYKLELDSAATEETQPVQEKKISTPIQAPKENPRIIKGENFIAELSYEEDKKRLPLTYSISADSLHFGDVEAGEALLRTHSISISAGSSNGYQVLAEEDHALMSGDKTQIPNTTCDSGSCSDILADYWESPLTYGFGYRCKGISTNSCSSSFEQGLYRRFSDTEYSENPSQIIFQNTNTDLEAIIEYKLNIAQTQAKGNYTNTVSYRIVPNL